MAIQFNTVKCPECGANLSIEEGREKVFCSYCGTQIIITNENERVYRHVDEARIKEAEVNQTLELKRLELEERKRLAKEKRTKIKIAVSIPAGIAAIGMLVAGFLTNADVALAGLFLLVCVAWIWMMGNKD